MQAASPADDAVAHVNVRSSWLAYVSRLVAALLALAAGEATVWFALGLRDPGDGLIWSFLAAMAVLIGSGSWLWYQLALVRSRVLQSDETGVRYVQGVLPWAKARIQVNWEDMEGATCAAGPFSRMLDAYRVRVDHRIRPDTRIMMPWVARGPDVAARINVLHQRHAHRQAPSPGAELARTGGTTPGPGH